MQEIPNAPNSPDRSYLTFSQEAETEYIEKKSRFIGFAAPAETEADALRIPRRLREAHPAAEHQTSDAYTIREGGVLLQRYSDDGEPQGTGGIPVLDVIKKQTLMNCILVVVRYFGGILLGAAGLVRAYGKSAAMAAEAAGIVIMTPCRRIRVVSDYPFYDKIRKAAEDLQLAAEPPQFDSAVTADYLVPETRLEAVCIALTEAAAGQLIIEQRELVFFPLSDSRK